MLGFFFEYYAPKADKAAPGAVLYPMFPNLSSKSDEEFQRIVHLCTDCDTLRMDYTSAFDLQLKDLLDRVMLELERRKGNDAHMDRWEV
jgi:hypothetical protein